MNQSFMGMDLSNAKKIIDTVDLNPTIERLVRIHKWSYKEAIAASKQYRNYLFLKKKYGELYPLPPSYDIDDVWHAHILHTEDYYSFCKQVFGRFLHHHPSHDNANIIEKDIVQMFEKTQELYQAEFGEYIRNIRPIPFKMRMQKFLQELRSN